MAAARFDRKHGSPGPRAQGAGSGERWDAAATRAALLSAGAALFAERGFDGVPTAAVAARAGVNKALISYHFGGKRGLYLAILASGFAAMAERLKAVEARGEDARETLAGCSGPSRRVRERRPDFPALFVREVLSRGIEPARAAPTSSRSSASRGASPSAGCATGSSGASTRPRCTWRSSAAWSSSSRPSRRDAAPWPAAPAAADAGLPRVPPLPRGADAAGARPRSPLPRRPRKGAHA